jgi:hypothetical protein
VREVSVNYPHTIGGHKYYEPFFAFNA